MLKINKTNKIKVNLKKNKRNIQKQLQKNKKIIVKKKKKKKLQ